MQVMLQRHQVLFCSHTRIHLSCLLFQPQTSNRRSSLAIHQAAACLRDIDSVQVVSSVCSSLTRVNTLIIVAQSCFAAVCNSASVSGSKASISALQNAGMRPIASARDFASAFQSECFAEVGYKFSFLTCLSQRTLSSSFRILKLIAPPSRILPLTRLTRAAAPQPR